MKPFSLLIDNIASGKENCFSLGCLPQTHIDFIEEKCPSYAGLLDPNTDILFWKDRIKHTELHRDDFISDIAFQNSFENIPKIIQQPDYISVHPKDNSISFIKTLSHHVSVAIRISQNGGLSYRTMYPITDAQLQNYISKNRAWKFSSNMLGYNR